MRFGTFSDGLRGASILSKVHSVFIGLVFRDTSWTHYVLEIGNVAGSEIKPKLLLRANNFASIKEVRKRPHKMARIENVLSVYSSYHSTQFYWPLLWRNLWYVMPSVGGKFTNEVEVLYSKI